jgi:hypothetical protein
MAVAPAMDGKKLTKIPSSSALSPPTATEEDAIWFIFFRSFVSAHPTFQKYIVNNTRHVFILAVPVNAEDVVTFTAPLFLYGIIIKSRVNCCIRK